MPGTPDSAEYLSFECPNCGGTTIEEIMIDVTVSTSIALIDSDGHIDYDMDQTNDGGEVYRFQCQTCGHYITTDGVQAPLNQPVSKIITDCDELAKWLLKQPYNQEKADDS